MRQKIHPNVREILQARIDAAIGRDLDLTLRQWAQVMEVLFPEDYLPPPKADTDDVGLFSFACPDDSA